MDPIDQLRIQFIARPTSTTSVTIPDVPDGTDPETYEIPEPVLAAQPMAFMWGPTDNTAYNFAVGDINNPGTLYFTKGNNPDSAPETNQIAVTSPAEALANGVKTAAMAIVWTAEKTLADPPDLYDRALATVTGVEGNSVQRWQRQRWIARPLHPHLCLHRWRHDGFLSSEGWNMVMARPGGPGSVHLCRHSTNLFPREGFEPESDLQFWRLHCVYPPNDSVPEAQLSGLRQRLSLLRFTKIWKAIHGRWYMSQIAGGWSVDVGENPFTGSWQAQKRAATPTRLWSGTLR